MKSSISSSSVNDRKFVAVRPPGEALRIVESDLLPASWVPFVTGQVYFNPAGTAWARTQSAVAVEQRVLKEMGLEAAFENSERERRAAWSARPELAEKAVGAVYAERERLAELAERSAFERKAERESLANLVTPSPFAA